MVGLCQDFQEHGGNDMRRFSYVLHEQVLPSMCLTCQGSGVSRVEIGSHDSTGIHG